MGNQTCPDRWHCADGNRAESAGSDHELSGCALARCGIIAASGSEVVEPFGSKRGIDLLRRNSLDPLPSIRGKPAADFVAYNKNLITFLELSTKHGKDRQDSRPKEGHGHIQEHGLPQMRQADPYRKAGERP